MALTVAVARERRIAVLFTEHDMDVVFAHSRPYHRAASRAGDRFRQAAEVRADPGCAKVYLGMGPDALGQEPQHLLRARTSSAMSRSTRAGEVAVLWAANGAGKSTDAEKHHRLGASPKAGRSSSTGDASTGCDVAHREGGSRHVPRPAQSSPICP